MEVWKLRELFQNPFKSIWEVPTMKQIWLLLILTLVLSSAVLAIDFDDEISDEDQETFDQILAPVMKIYNFIKYSATVIAVLALMIAGINFVTSGGDVAKREQTKSTAFFIVIGLIIIWVAPYIIGLFT